MLDTGESGEQASALVSDVRRHLADDLDAPGALDVVDAWAGWADVACTRPWERDTLVAVSVAAGVGEELAYRGYAIPLLAVLMGVPGAAVLTSMRAASRVMPAAPTPRPKSATATGSPATIRIALSG